MARKTRERRDWAELERRYLSTLDYSSGFYSPYYDLEEEIYQHGATTDEWKKLYELMYDDSDSDPTHGHRVDCGGNLSATRYGRIMSRVIREACRMRRDPSTLAWQYFVLEEPTFFNLVQEAVADELRSARATARTSL